MGWEDNLAAVAATVRTGYAVLLLGPPPRFGRAPQPRGREAGVPIAARLGLKVLQGFWISNNAAKTKIQFDTAADIANRYPETVRAVVVGNEVLLRGDLSAADLAASIRAMKAAVKVPVTYADVWEFWLRAPDVAAGLLRRPTSCSPCQNAFSSGEMRAIRPNGYPTSSCKQNPF